VRQILGPLATPAAKQANATAIFDDLAAVTVKLKLVEPLRSHGGGDACDWLAWADEMWLSVHAQNILKNHAAFMTSSHPGAAQERQLIHRTSTISSVLAFIDKLGMASLPLADEAAPFPRRAEHLERLAMRRFFLL